MLDLPQPFGPTTAVIGWSKSRMTLSEKDLKPTMSILRMRILDPGRVGFGEEYRGPGQYPQPPDSRVFLACYALLRPTFRDATL